MSTTDIDRVNGYTIRKLHSPDKTKTFGYISGIKDSKGNLSDIMQHASLTDARNARGFVVTPCNTPTPPKSFYPQNQKGYDPHSAKR